MFPWKAWVTSPDDVAPVPDRKIPVVELEVKRRVGLPRGLDIWQGSDLEIAAVVFISTPFHRQSASLEMRAGIPRRVIGLDVEDNMRLYAIGVEELNAEERYSPANESVEITVRPPRIKF